MDTRYVVAALVVLALLIIAYVVLGARRKGTFIPQRVSTCSGKQNVIVPDPQYGFHEWTGQQNANWTVPEQLWDPDSKTQLFRGALTASASKSVLPVNPDSRIGVLSKVLRWDNPYLSVNDADSPCSKKLSVFDVQPFQAGYMIPAKRDTTDGTKYEQRYYYQPEFWSRASGPYGGPYHPIAACETGTVINKGPDCGAPGCQEKFYGSSFWWQQAGASPAPSTGRYTADLEQDTGVPGSTGYQKPLRSEASFVLPKETLRSRNNSRARGDPSKCGGDDCLTGIGCGLGSTWIDSRFEPGIHAMYPDSTYSGAGASIWAHGGHAGGPTFGAFMPTNFITSGTWNKYVHGFGDGNLVAPCKK